MSKLSRRGQMGTEPNSENQPTLQIDKVLRIPTKQPLGDNCRRRTQEVNLLETESLLLSNKTCALKHPCFPRICTSETLKLDSTPKDLDSGELKHFRVSLPPKFTVENATKTGGDQNIENAMIRFPKSWFWKIEDFGYQKSKNQTISLYRFHWRSQVIERDH